MHTVYFCVYELRAKVQSPAVQAYAPCLDQVRKKGEVHGRVRLRKSVKKSNLEKLKLRGRLDRGRRLQQCMCNYASPRNRIRSWLVLRISTSTWWEAKHWFDRVKFFQHNSDPNWWRRIRNESWRVRERVHSLCSSVPEPRKRGQSACANMRRNTPAAGRWSFSDGCLW